MSVARHPTTKTWTFPPERAPDANRTNLKELAARPERFEHHLTVVARLGVAQLEIATASEPVLITRVLFRGTVTTASWISPALTTTGVTTGVLPAHPAMPTSRTDAAAAAAIRRRSLMPPVWRRGLARAMGGERCPRTGFGLAHPRASARSRESGAGPRARRLNEEGRPTWDALLSRCARGDLNPHALTGTRT